MNQTTIIRGLAQLGNLFRLLGKSEPWPGFNSGITETEYVALDELILRQKAQNGWFVEENVRGALLALGEMMDESSLESWTKAYRYCEKPKKVAVIMAGNIPLVGFHDFMCVLLSGHHVVAKLSSEDKQLLPAFAEVLNDFIPEIKSRITFTSGMIGVVDAVIATGSDNSITYFKQYFGKYPHIFRKNRTSVAVLDGTESEAELNSLGVDIFSYFGLGCRNVTHLILPEAFELDRFFKAILPFGEVVYNHKYANNYDYNKAIYLLNQMPLLDNNFVLLRESENLFSPLAMIHYHRYKNQDEINDYLLVHRDEIQVVVGHGYTPFGKAQAPGLDDYADGVDTMRWLETI